MLLSELLVGGRAEVEKGWCKKTLCNTAEEVCTIGGLLVAAGAERDERLISYAHIMCREVYVQAIRLLTQLSPCLDFNGNPSLLSFNNHPDTTKEDVLSWFDAAIAIAKSREAEVQCEQETKVTKGSTVEEDGGTTQGEEVRACQEA